MERIRIGLGKKVIRCERKEIRVRVSIGVCSDVTSPLVFFIFYLFAFLLKTKKVVITKV